jgi:hypothetical protein
MNNITRRAMFQRGGKLGAVLALDAVSPALAGTTPAASSVEFKAIDAALRGGVSKNDVAGVVAMAATPKGVVYEGAFGKANVATGAPMMVDTVFWLLSMTKAFTATACMQLIEQGRLHLDDDAAKYLPGAGLAAGPRRIRRGWNAATAAGQGRDQGAPSADAYLWLHLLDLERGSDPLRAGDGHARHRDLQERRLHRSARIRAWRAVGIRHQHGLGRQAGGSGVGPIARNLLPREHLRSARSVKGTTTLDSVIAELVEASRARRRCGRFSRA